MRLSGKKRAEQLVRFADAAVTQTEQTIGKLHIDCDYNPSGNVLAEIHDAHRSRLLKAAEAAKTVGDDAVEALSWCCTFERIFTNESPSTVSMRTIATEAGLILGLS
jgi:hypothetical protein